jgi:hypothetical protein
VSSLWAILALAVVHAAAGTTAALRRRWQSGLLSAAAGISIAYVFVELMPNVARWQQVIGTGGLIRGLEHQTGMFALAGFAVALGVENAARRARTRQYEEGAAEADVGPFHLNIASAALMNAAIGYTMANPGNDAIQPLWLFALAIGLYLAVNDHALAEHHEERYHRHGRWLLVAALIAGWAVGTVPALEISSEALALLIAYLVGGVILNVMRHQLPYTDRTADALAFAVGAIVFGCLTLARSVI